MKYKTDAGVAGLTILFSIIVLLFIIGLIVMIFTVMNAEMSDATRQNYGGQYSENFISSSLIEQLNIPEKNNKDFQITSALFITPNQTWINFDGVNDYVNLSISGYSTISFWYKTSTQTSWTNVINSSGTIYINGSASAITIYPIKQNGNILQIGYNGTYFNGSIDEIRTYNFNLNSTQALEVYNEGR